MTDEVVFGPIKPPTDDWRWREILGLEPFEVMKELKELDANLFAARSEFKEAVRELVDFEDRMHGAKQETLEGVLNGTDQGLADSLFEGGTKDERAQRQETYLAGLEWVKQAEIEIGVAKERKDNAQVAFDSLLDRQTNLGKFANMYSATAHLLASILVVVPLKETVVPGGSVRTLYADAIRTFAGQTDGEVHPALSKLYEQAQSWVQWARDAVGEPPIPTDVLATRIIEVGKPVQAPPDLEPVVLAEEAEEGADRYFGGEVLPPEVVAAVGRYEDDLSL